MLVLASVPLGWILAALWLDWRGRRGRAPETVDALIVPGCAVRPDGTPSGSLRRRTERAIALWHDGVAPTLVLTGGLGRFPPAEAVAAAELAQAHGIPATALVLEDRSTTTAENAAYAARLLEEPTRMSVLVVTDCFHAWRCTHLFRRHFKCVAAIGTVPPFRPRLRGAMREVAATVWMALRIAVNERH